MEFLRGPELISNEGFVVAKYKQILLKIVLKNVLGILKVFYLKTCKQVNINPFNLKYI